MSYGSVPNSISATSREISSMKVSREPENDPAAGKINEVLARAIDRVENLNAISWQTYAKVESLDDGDSKGNISPSYENESVRSLMQTLHAKIDLLERTINNISSHF